MAKAKNSLLKSLLVEFSPIFLLFIVLLLYYVYYLIRVANKYDEVVVLPANTWDQTINIWDLNRSWFVEQWGEIMTWLDAEEIWHDINPIPRTDLELYTSYVQKWNIASFSPASQWEILWWYAEKSKAMNTYLANNTFKFNIPNTIKKWYLYIKLYKPSTNWIFLFWYWSDKNWFKVSWDLKLESNLINWSSEEYLYDISDIQYVRFYDEKLDSYDWLSELQDWKSGFIAGFLRDYSWNNKIEQIVIAWE